MDGVPIPFFYTNLAKVTRPLFASTSDSDVSIFPEKRKLLFSKIEPNLLIAMSIFHAYYSNKLPIEIDPLQLDLSKLIKNDVKYKQKITNISLNQIRMIEDILYQRFQERYQNIVLNEITVNDEFVKFIIAAISLHEFMTEREEQAAILYLKNYS